MLRVMIGEVIFFVPYILTIIERRIIAVTIIAILRLLDVICSRKSASGITTAVSQSIP